MAGISDDLSQVLEEVGSEITVINATDPSLTEYADIVKSDKEGFFVGTFISETTVFSGGIVNITTTSEKYLVLSTLKPQFENSPVLTDGVLVRCTNTCEIGKSVEVKNPVTRQKEITWTYGDTCYCYISQTTTGNTINSEFQEMSINEKNKKMYASNTYDVKRGDRVRFPSGTTLEVGDIDELRYPGVLICELFEDER